MSHDFMMGMLSKGGAFIMGAVIKSIQSGTITIPTDVNGESATITEVDLSKSVVLFLGSSGGSTTHNKLMALLYLLDSTTVRAVRSSATGAANDCVEYCVVEFESGIASRQEVLLQLDSPNAQVDVTITEVDVAKTVLFYGGKLASGTGNSANSCSMRAWLENSTTVRGYREATGNSVWTRITVMEFS